MSPVFYSNSTCDSFFIGFSEYTVHPSLKNTFAIKLCNPFMAETNSGAVPAGRCPSLYRFDDLWLRNRTSRRIAVKPAEMAVQKQKNRPKFVRPAEAGIQEKQSLMDSGFRGNDAEWRF